LNKKSSDYIKADPITINPNKMKNLATHRHGGRNLERRVLPHMSVRLKCRSGWKFEV